MSSSESADDPLVTTKNALYLLKQNRHVEAVNFLLGSSNATTDPRVKDLYIWLASRVSSFDESAKRMFESSGLSFNHTDSEKALSKAVALRTLDLLDSEQKFDPPMTELWLATKVFVSLLPEFQEHRGYQIFQVHKILGLTGLIEEKSGAFAITERGERYLGEAADEQFGELTKLEKIVLAELERIESRLINIGIYETAVESSIVTNEIPDYPALEVEKSLSSLCEKKFALKLQDGYRSRTAEIARLLYLVRQRFRPGNRGSRPRLVRAVKVKISPRMIPLFSVHAPEAVESLERVIRNSAAWPDYQGVWDEGKKIFEIFLARINFTAFSKFQLNGLCSIFQNLLNLEKNRSVGPKGNVLVAGTGTGKTETFLFPHILFLILKKLRGDASETLLFCIYPRVRLSINQLERFLKYIAEVNDLLGSPDAIRVGMANKDVPPTWDQLYKDDCKRDSKGTRVLAFSGRVVLRCTKLIANDQIGLRASCDKPIPLLDSEHLLKCADGHSVPYLPTRTQLAEKVPDIVILTPEMLHQLLMQSSLTPLFRGPIKTLVLDEIHIYESLHASQMSRLLRRYLRKVSELGAGALVVGSSATVAVPRNLFWALTSISLREDEVIQPAESELEESGTEIYYFVKPETVSLVQKGTSLEEKRVSPMSTLIQSMMVTMHNVRRRRRKYKAIGFIDSVSSLYGWVSDQRSAENSNLYALRTQPNLGAENVSGCNSCAAALGNNPPSAPDPLCPLFQEGECWWFPHFDDAQYRSNVGLRISQVSSVEEIDFDEDWDVVCSTSTLEVGFDDSRLLGIIQYKVPHSTASFLQRKGRGARNPEDRSITVLVVNPYNADDLYYFRHSDDLLSMELAENTINPDNYFVQRAHFQAAIFDLISTRSQDLYHIKGEDDIKSLATFMSQNAKAIIEWNKSIAPLYSEYWDADKSTAALLESFRWGLSQNRRKNAVDLSDYIPKTMFDDLNVPRTQVMENWEDVDEALVMLSPGNPTYKFRVNNVQAWCPISSIQNLAQTNWIDPTYCNELNPPVEVEQVPLALRPLFGQEKRIQILRPRKIAVAAFSGYKYCPDCSAVLRSSTPHSHGGKDRTKPLHEKTKAYPIGTYLVTENAGGQSLKEVSPHADWLGLRDMISEHRFFSDYKNSLNVMKVYLATHIFAKVGTSFPEALNPATMTFQLPSGARVAYGFGIKTEGFSISLNESETTSIIARCPPAIARQLSTQFLMSRVVSLGVANPEFNTFTAAKVAEVLATLSALLGDKSKDFLSAFANSGSSVTSPDTFAPMDWLEGKQMGDPLTEPGSFMRYVKGRFYPTMPNSDWIEVLHTFHSPTSRGQLIQILEDTKVQGQLDSFAFDVLQHSFKHVLQRAAAIVAGVGTESISGTFYPKTEFGTAKNGKIYVFETQMGGNGTTRTIARNVLNRPGASSKKDLVSLVEDFSLYCPTGDSEDVIRSKLFSALPSEIQSLKEQLLSAKSGDIAPFRAKVAKTLGIHLSEDLMEMLAEILTDKIINGQQLNDFAFYREIWVCGKLAEAELGRPPTEGEVVATMTLLVGKTLDLAGLAKRSAGLGSLVSGVGAIVEFKESERLMNIVEDQKIFIEEILKRTLLSGSNTCPECLSGDCTYFDDSASDLFLNRNLLKYVVFQAHAKYSLSAAEAKQPERLMEAVKARGFAYVTCSLDEVPKVSSEILKVLSSEFSRTPFLREARPINFGDEYLVEFLVDVR